MRADQLSLLAVDELASLAGERDKMANESGGLALVHNLELGDVIVEARERLPADRAFGEWWAGTGITCSGRWRKVLIDAGRRWRAEGRPGMNLVHTDGRRFSLKRYAAGGDPYAETKISANESLGTDEYYTPAWIFEALGVRFDLDVCSPPDGSNVPCDRFIAPPRDGLVEPWEGTVWMNPPFSHPTPWVTRFIAHGNGICLLPFAKSAWFFTLWDNPVVDIVTCGPKASTFDGGTIYMPVFLAAIGKPRDALAELGAVR